MKYALTLIVVFCCLQSFAQGDFILLRKDNVVIQSYFKDSYLKCQLNNGQWIEGRIKQIKADSLFLEQIQVRQVASIFGTPMLDTLRYGAWHRDGKQWFVVYGGSRRVYRVEYYQWTHAAQSVGYFQSEPT